MASSGQTNGPSDQIPSDVATRANELYWNSTASVNRLAEELDLSKGALYELIEPLPVGFPCPEGDGELVYANRTARDRAFVTCPTCGFEEEEAHVVAHMEREGRNPILELPLREMRASGPDKTLEKLLLGSALVGFAVGLGLSSLFRRR